MAPPSINTGEASPAGRNRSNSVSGSASGPLSPISPKARSRSQSGLESMSPCSPSRKRSPKFEEFLQRQSGDSKTELRRKICKLHRDLIVEANEDYDLCNWGTHGAEGFRKKLAVHSGSVAAAWRTVLDPDDKGALSAGGFCEKMREIGFAGHIRKLWLEIDQDGDGFVSLYDLDPEAAESLATFKQRVIDRFGSTIEWWKSITRNKPGMMRLSDTEFAEACKDLGYSDQNSVNSAFKCLQIGVGHKYLTLAEIDPPAARAKKSADPCAEGIAAGMGRSAPVLVPDVGRSSLSKMLEATLTESTMSPAAKSEASTLRPGEDGFDDPAPPPVCSPKGPPARPRPLALSTSLPSFKGAGDATPQQRQATTPHSTMGHTNSFREGVASPTRTARWVREISCVQRANLASSKSAFMSKLQGTKDLQSLRHNLIAQYGSLYDAWREGFKFPDERGKLNFVEFCDVMRNMGYVGNIKALFSELDKDKTEFISLKELDPDVFAKIKTYKELLKKKHGNLAKAWAEALGEANAQGKVTKNEFLKHVKELGWEGDASDLFKHLQREPRSVFLHLRDFDKGAYLALCRSDPEMISETNISTHKLDFDDRQQLCFRQRWSRHQSEMQMKEIADVHKAEREANMAAGDAATLRRMLTRKYGTLALAWKNKLDLDCHGRLSWVTFCEAMRRVGYMGDLKAVFKELDPQELGYVTLGSFDKEVDDALNSFRQQLADRYGDLITAWRTALDVQRVGRLEEHFFVERFKELGLVGDPKLIFLNLQAWMGRRFITLADLDQRHAEAWYRDDLNSGTVKMPHGQGESWTPAGQQKKALAESLARAAADSTPVSPTSPSGPMISETPMASPTAMSMGSSSPKYGNSMSLASTASPKHGGSEVHRDTHLSGWSRELGSRFRKKLQITDMEERDKHMGCKELNEFKKRLARKYGSIITAWRAGLDLDGNGRLSHNEFCIVSRANGFAGDFKEMWAAFGGEATGFVTLEALDKGSWEGVVALRDLFVKNCGCLLGAWEYLSDEDAWIDEPRFYERLQKLGFDPGAKYVHKLFVSLMAEKGKRYMFKEDLQALLIGTPTSERSTVWRGWKKPPVETLPRKDVLMRAIENLKGVMTRKFGCLYAGWWKGIDMEGQDRVSVADFELRVNAIGYGSNFKSLLKVLGKEQGDVISFRDIDPQAAKAIEVFSDMVCAKYGSFETGWKEGLKVHWDGPPQNKCYDKEYEQSGMVDEKAFVKFCTELGYPYDARELMKAFLPEVYDSIGVRSDKGVLYFEDFGPVSMSTNAPSPTARRKILLDANHASPRDREPRFLFAGGASPSHSALENNVAALMPPTTGSPGVSPPLSPKSPKSPKMGESLDAGEPLSPKSSMGFGRNLFRALEASKDFGAKDYKQVQRAACHKYGTLSAAWRRGMDLSGKGRVSFPEFSEAMRNLSFTGDIKQLWAEIVQEADHLTFDVFAPDVDAALKEFFGLLKESYGGIQEAWRSLDDNHNGWLEEEELESVCKKLGFSGDHRKLFKWLKIEPGTRHITLTDLQENAKVAHVSC
eukprot:TRINITY_DN62735_c0_g1_i1.p1 TRINITY_DN62735_c0_g1~~TRINITY_DN62735_c0_g1_i1.p1  ORF type:complete len:1541 (+),score=406.02 TRINITY_DN62735_c0_g1_i1:121-4743(+)